MDDTQKWRMFQEFLAREAPAIDPSLPLNELDLHAEGWNKGKEIRSKWAALLRDHEHEFFGIPTTQRDIVLTEEGKFEDAKTQENSDGR